MSDRQNRPSASGLARLFACPGSWQAEQQMEPEPTSADAALGTELHAHMEHGTTPADPEQAEAVDWCREKQQELATLYLGEDARVLMREKRLWHHYDHNLPCFSGQADIIYTSADHTKYLILDYKFGRTAVENAASNIQLAALAALLYLNTPETEGKQIYAAILQPYVSRTPQITLYNAGDCQRAVHAIEGAIETAEKENPALRPSENACRYCRAAACCPAAVRETLTLQTMQHWVALNPQQKRDLYDKAQLAKKLAEKIENACRDDLANGISIPGLTISNGSKKFTIKDPSAAFTALAPAGITAQEFAACCTLPIGKLEKLFHAKQKAKAEQNGTTVTEKDSRALLEKLLANCAETTTTKGSLKKA